MKDFKRGDVIYVDLGQHANSSIQSGMRPCVVLSNNKSNRYSTNLCVCPFSGQLKDNPVHVKVKPSDVEGYDEKLFEITRKIHTLSERRALLDEVINKQKDVGRRMSALREILKTEKVLDVFDRDVFESIIEKVIVGGYDKDGNPDPEPIVFTPSSQDEYNFSVTISMKPSRRPLKPAPQESPSRKTLKKAPHECSPSKSLITH